MRQASVLLGVMTLVVAAGAYYAFSSRPQDPAPIVVEDDLRENPEEALPDTEEVLDISPTQALTLTAPAFMEGERMPSRYTCDAEDVSPELIISGIPVGTQSLVLVMDDADISPLAKERLGKDAYDHWVLYNIPSDTTVIPEGDEVGNAGFTTRGTLGYMGPCPPDGEHRYVFRLYALTGSLNFIQAPTLRDVEGAAQGMMIASTSLMGRYERTK